MFPFVLFTILILSFVQLNPYIINTPNHEKLDFNLKKITTKQTLDQNNTYLQFKKAH